jgi:hypothetical protein
MAGDFRYAEYEMLVRNLFEDIYTDPDKSLKIVLYAAVMIGPL